MHDTLPPGKLEPHVQLVAITSSRLRSPQEPRASSPSLRYRRRPGARRGSRRSAELLGAPSSAMCLLPRSTEPHHVHFRSPNDVFGPPMDLIDTLGPLGLIGIFLGNELALALAAESYGMLYIPMRAAVIPACSILLVTASIVRWGATRPGLGEQNAPQRWRLVGAGAGICTLTFQWLASGPLFSS
jgi:hypothetical protein